MEKELLDVLSHIMENMATKDDLKASETRVQVFIENTVSSKISALFDGYKESIENQTILKISNDNLTKELDDIKIRLTILENRIA